MTLRPLTSGACGVAWPIGLVIRPPNRGAMRCAYDGQMSLFCAGCRQGGWEAPNESQG